MLEHLTQRLSRWLAVQVQHGNGPATRLLATDGHGGNVHAVLSKDRPDTAYYARHIPVREDEQNAIEVGVEVKLAQPYNSQELLAENCAGRLIAVAFGLDLGMDQGGEVPLLG